MYKYIDYYPNGITKTGKTSGTEWTADIHSGRVIRFLLDRHVGITEIKQKLRNPMAQYFDILNKSPEEAGEILIDCRWIVFNQNCMV